MFENVQWKEKMKLLRVDVKMLENCDGMCQALLIKKRQPCTSIPFHMLKMKPSISFGMNTFIHHIDGLMMEVSMWRAMAGRRPTRWSLGVTNPLTLVGTLFLYAECKGYVP
jgi:hypothetical protein